MTDLRRVADDLTALRNAPRVAAGGSVAAGDVTGLSEYVDDRVAALLIAGANVTLAYNDGANTLTVAASGGGGGNSYFPGGWA